MYSIFFSVMFSKLLGRYTEETLHLHDAAHLHSGKHNISVVRYRIRVDSHSDDWLSQRHLPQCVEQRPVGRRWRRVLHSYIKYYTVADKSYVYLLMSSCILIGENFLSATPIPSWTFTENNYFQLLTKALSTQKASDSAVRSLRRTFSTMCSMCLSCLALTLFSCHTEQAVVVLAFEDYCSIDLHVNEVDRGMSSRSS